MKRRSFIKSMLVGLPALWLHPAASLAETIQAPSFNVPAGSTLFFFLGEYGKRVSAQTRRLDRQRGPTCPCRSTPPGAGWCQRQYDIPASAREIRLPFPPPDSAALIGIVYDAREAGASATAAALATAYRHRKGSPVLAFERHGAPAGSSLVTADLVIDTSPLTPFETARSIVTVDNTYSNCSGLGNCICFREILNDLRFGGLCYGRILAAAQFAAIGDPAYGMLLGSVKGMCAGMPATSDSGHLMILEMPAQVHDPIGTWEKIRLDLYGAFDDYLSHMLPHPSLRPETYRVTMMALTPIDRTESK